MFAEETRQWAAEVLHTCEAKYSWVADKHCHGIPYTTDPDGNYDNRADEGGTWAVNDGINWWTNGFWGGILWHLYASTGKERFAHIATHSEQLLDRSFEQFYGLHHDVGFMWIPTAVANYTLTGNPESRKRALHAASLLIGRFNLSGRFLRAWNDHDDVDTRGWAIIDSMLNIPLLNWATEETCDPRYRQVAMAHADAVMQSFIRDDGSSDHIVEFDPSTGERLRAHGGQGYRNGSAWTRGQGWAIYGFAIAHAQTGKSDYLHTAERVADYFISRIPASGLIPIDFDQPVDEPWEDSCGAAVAACGLLKLAKHCAGAAGERYAAAAVAILRALDEYRSDYTGG